MARQGSAPIAREKLLPSEDGFDPETYLAIFHGDSSAPQLASGVRALERELGESTGQLKQLVKQNFERFISCKTTIDDIYTKLHRIESTQTGLSTEVLYNAIQEVRQGWDQPQCAHVCVGGGNGMCTLSPAYPSLGGAADW
jgi:hypothetical protein